MKMHRLIPFALIALAGLSMSSGCPTAPSLKERIVELALGGSTTLTIPAAGIINTYNQDGDENLNADVDLQKILSDAGVDAQNCKSIKLAGISYRVTIKDPNTGRSIDGGTVTAQRVGVGAATPLITAFSVQVDKVTNWTKAPLDPAGNGVALINGVLADILTAAKNGGSVVNPTIRYHVNGTSNPQGATTNFTWQLKLDVTIVGTIKVKVLT